MSAPMVAFARCRDCDWTPDPAKPMQRQAERHTDEEQHTTEAGWERRPSDAK